jgi:hypothetical protein
MTNQINAISGQYNLASTEVSQLKEQLRQLQTVCPSLVHGSVVLDVSAPETKYYVDNGVLRPLSEKDYRAIGRPEIKTFPTLENCTKGGAMQPFVEMKMNVVVDGASWDNLGIIKVLRLNTTNASLETTDFTRDSSVAWLVNENGTIRSLALNGQYMTDNDCSVPVASDVPSVWRLEQMNHPRKFKIVSASCGKYLNTSSGAVSLTNETVNGFYIIPIGTVKIPA